MKTEKIGNLTNAKNFKKCILNEMETCIRTNKNAKRNQKNDMKIDLELTKTKFFRNFN